MSIEIRNANGKKKYYLSYAYRSGSKVKKIRVYLGANLSKEELESAVKTGMVKLQIRITGLKEIKDPYLTVLSKNELDELKKLDTKTAIKLQHLSEENWQKFTELFTYNTNAIEGSAVENFEVKDILEKGQWPDKSKEDISETIGVAEAVAFIRRTKEHISVSLIKEFHRLVFKNSKPFAGKLRKIGVEVGVYDSRGNLVHKGASSTQVLSLLKKLVGWYKSNEKHYPALLLAAIVHNQFENIHPFEDGNGRVGRLLLINILLKHGMPPVNIELANRQEYYEALQRYENDGDIRPTIDLLLKEYRKLRKELKR